MFDTHCHLNFKAFEKNVDEVIKNARNIGITHIVIPGTDIVSSQKAIEIAQKYDGVYAAVGIHPHHVYELYRNDSPDSSVILSRVDGLLRNDKGGKIIAIGEIGIDRHIYQKTKYEEYVVDEEFIRLQKEFFIAQLKLAMKYKKSVIIHNREAKEDLLPILRENWDSFFEWRLVFHCCEPDEELLVFAKDHHIFIGIDGDVTYRKEKTEFIKNVPIEMLVLETDSPFLLPEPLRVQKKFPNTPANLLLIAEHVAKVRGENIEVLKKQTFANGLSLFKLQS